MPPVDNGQYTVTVYPETESSGGGGPGAKVEAFVGGTRCGLASVRESEGFVGCTTGAPLRFRIDGQTAAPTAAVNTPPVSARRST